MLGLITPTDPRWIDAALSDFGAVLLDHFHCELKAAANATGLIGRYPSHHRLVRELGALAQEELSHVGQVHDELVRRGVATSPPGPDEYALALRKAAARDAFRDPLVDRLLVGALIEARSCERFGILKEHHPDAAVRAWYADLFASEARHFRLFSSLAEDTAGFETARARLSVLAEREADLVAKLPLLPRIH